jgi:transcriptional regulator with XRE-family HTH domain
MALETQGERIRRARDERGLKQGYVSRTAVITQAHLSRIENDESGVTDHTLKKIATAIGVPFEDLVVRKDPTRDEGPRVVNIDDVLASEAAMTRFLNGERPDKETYEWVRRSLAVIRAEVRRRKEW